MPPAAGNRKPRGEIRTLDPIKDLPQTQSPPVVVVVDFTDDDENAEWLHRSRKRGTQ